MNDWLVYFFYSALIAWLFVAGISCFGVAYTRWRFGRPLSQRPLPPAVVIIPVNGARSLRALLQGLRVQTGVRFRVVFAVESEADPAYAGLLAQADGSLERRVIVAGPASDDTGQKIHNQLAALKLVGPEDEVVVFADSDIVPQYDWLARLIAPLEDPAHGAVTGYRWLTPNDRRISTLLACLANNSIATTPPSVHYNIAWGGSTALRRETLEAVRIGDWWQGAIADDLQLTRALWRQGRRILGSRDLLVPSPISCSWREAIEFGRRQYALLRIHMPRYWAVAAAATSLPLLGWAVAIPLAAAGDGFAIATLAAATIFDQLRASLRLAIQRRLSYWPIDRGLARLDRWATPAWLLFHAAIIWSTLFQRRISWAGRVYDVRGPQSIRLITGPAPFGATAQRVPGSSDG